MDHIDDARSGSANDHPEKPASTGQASHVAGDALLLDKQGNIRHLPIPSNDPNDPLNFKTWEKAAVIFCCCWFSCMSLALVGGLGPILGVFFGMYAPQGYSPSQIVYLLTIPSLCVGLGNYIVLPLALAYGRRPVFLGSSVALLASTIGAASQNSYSGHLGARIVQGLATGATESVLPLMLTEVTFLHQRSRVFGLYWMVQSLSGGLLNIASSYINAALGWQWFYWVYVITIATGFVASIFGAFETRFARPAMSVDGVIVYTDEFGVTHVVPSDEVSSHPELQAQGLAGLPDDAPYDGPQPTFKNRIALWGKPHPTPGKIILSSWVLMVKCLTSPAIIYAILISSVCLAVTIDMSLTYDAALQAYGWAAESIGLINIAAVVGSILGSAYTVLIGDWLVLWLAKRNNGVHKPEHRIIVLIPVAILGFAMTLVYAFTVQGASSYWGLVLSNGFYNMAWVAVLIISTTFAAEVWPKHPGPALVMVVGSKNIVSFCLTFAFTPMMEHGGITWAFCVLAGVFGACFVLGFPVYFLNTKWRKAESKKDNANATTD
ncbi:major facilitator superfamily domain-containing protein [Microdochium trichocladiopsis]|uniref:Major facilitator superfamily domain-containing protein n=1 Tax=Microdochium trichocladiopsis TaxID=1682393 RepID=A0A9P8XVM5_9PEZI|nr:major facilitator superfamily domain-containing protein [Microdochium trichocladiopsis]KAH7021361.1 major facilitator superfamily domain-containing protein [Microdochium trichocladiopsis]